MNPRPGEGSQINKDDTIIPDLIVNKRSNQWEIIVNDNWIPSLQISKIYHKMIDDLDSQTTKTKKFLKHNYTSAKWFIQAVEQRRETLVNVMNEIINHQSEFFKGNIEAIDDNRNITSRVTFLPINNKLNYRTKKFRYKKDFCM